MPLYEYRCHTCDTRFEMRRPMAESSDPAPCPGGHDDTLRLLSTFGALTTAATGPSPSGGGGGCCGGGCGCAR